MQTYFCEDLTGYQRKESELEGLGLWDRCREKQFWQQVHGREPCFLYELGRWENESRGG